MRFKRPTSQGCLIGKNNPDAKSALLGRLVIRYAIHKELGIPFSEMQFGRTKENKPFLKNKISKYLNFNFNISHAGEWVVFASEPFNIVGIDVMEMAVRGRKNDEGILDFFKTMRNCFTVFEWKNISYNSNNLQKQVEQFFRHWTLKESYIKAVGIGLGFELQRVEFTLDNNERGKSATVRIDGKEVPEWQFYLYYPDERHVIACAIGHPKEATNNFQKTFLNQLDLESKQESTSGSITFTELVFDDLLKSECQ